MEIVIIGTGNTAAVLGRMLKAAGHTILQVFGRNASAASELAYELDCESTNYWAVVDRNADLYLLAVSDIAIEEIIRELKLPDKTIVHTAAAVPKDALRSATEHYGVFYPLQSLKKGTGRLPDVPVIIDASDKETYYMLQQLAGSISDQVVAAGDEVRLKLHLAAVFCNNFVNHIYALMEDYCRREKIDFRLLIPLIRETAERIESMSPADAQTGPAIRHDQGTINKHLQLLENHHDLKKIYLLLTASIAGNA